MSKSIVNRNYRKEPNGNSRTEKYNIWNKNSLSLHPLEITEEGVSEPKDGAVEIFFLKNGKKKDLKNWTEKNEKSLGGLCDISKNV